MTYSDIALLEHIMIFADQKSIIKAINHHMFNGTDKDAAEEWLNLLKETLSDARVDAAPKKDWDENKDKPKTTLADLRLIYTVMTWSDHDKIHQILANAEWNGDIDEQDLGEDLMESIMERILNTTEPIRLAEKQTFKPNKL